MACWPLNSASVRGSSVPSTARPTSESLTSRPLRLATTTWSKSVGPSSRPLRRMVRSVSASVTRPTGAARFWLCIACTTSATVTPAASSFAGSSSIDISRSILPCSLTSATPGTLRSSLTMSGSASCVSSGAAMLFDERMIETIGKPPGSKRVSTGSFISGGRSSRILEMESRMSCDASFRSLS
jgi:hypothetical protein